MVAPPTSTLATLFMAHAPVEEYRRRRQAAGAPAAAVPLAAIDSFLMGRVAAYAPLPPHIIDLAADATDGESVAFWVATGRPVIVPRVSWAPPPVPDWRPLLRAWAAERTTSHGAGNAAAHLTIVETTLSGLDEWRAITVDIPEGTPLIGCLAESAQSAADTAAHLALLHQCAPDATVLLMPLGLTGTGPVLAHALCACPPGGAQRLVALREVAPFFATSALGLVSPADDTMIPTVLERIANLVAGNFQFITLLQETIAAATREADYAARLERIESAHVTESVDLAAGSVDTERADLRAVIAELHEAMADKTAYAQSLEDRLRYLEETYLPWKNSVIAELDREIRGLDASKSLRAERLVRRLLRR